ncbi:MAG: hypothetical protein ACK4N5_12840, partial [Myxococcales bacterium]
MSALLHRALRLLALLLLVALASPARAEGDPLRVARYNFDYGKYADAIALVNDLIARKLIADGPDLIEANRILGLSHFYLGRREEARAAFVNLLLVEPDYALDPLLVPPLAIVEFDDVKRQNEKVLASIRERRKAIAEQKRLEEEERRKLLEDEERRRRDRDNQVTVQKIERHSYLANFAPVGIGQFEQKRYAMGALFASTQVLGAAAAGLSYYRVASNLERKVGDGWRVHLSQSTLDALKWTNYAGLGLALLSYAASVGDALYHHQPETVSWDVVPRDSLISGPSAAPRSPAAPLPQLYLS